MHRRTGQHEKTASNCPAESCVTREERVGTNFARRWWLGDSEGLIGIFVGLGMLRKVQVPWEGVGCCRDEAAWAAKRQGGT